jgi:hypothetical protein
MARMDLYLADDELAWVKEQKEGFVRGLVLEAMGKKPKTLLPVNGGPVKKPADWPRYTCSDCGAAMEYGQKKCSKCGGI